jgi:hypothetical protein
MMTGVQEKSQGRINADFNANVAREQARLAAEAARHPDFSNVIGKVSADYGSPYSAFSRQLQADMDAQPRSFWQQPIEERVGLQSGQLMDMRSDFDPTTGLRLPQMRGYDPSVEARQQQSVAAMMAIGGNPFAGMAYMEVKALGGDDAASARAAIGTAAFTQPIIDVGAGIALAPRISARPVMGEPAQTNGWLVNRPMITAQERAEMMLADRPRNNAIVANSAVRGSVVDARFAQPVINPEGVFSPKGQKIYSGLAGREIKTVQDLSDAISRGEIHPGQIPVDFVDLDGARFILNTRTSTALRDAGVPRADWFGRNQTGQIYDPVTGGTFDDLARGQLSRNVRYAVPGQVGWPELLVPRR